MNRETTLGAGIVALVVVAAVVAAAAPGVLAEPDREERPGRVRIQEVTIAPGPVSGSEATLSVTPVLAHRGATSENVSVRVRATSLDSGLVEATRETALEPIEGDREVSVTLNATVAREGGYRIETIVYQDGRRVDEATKAVRGVGSLRPDDAKVRFQWSGGAGESDLPPIYVSVENVSGDRVALSLAAPLTNEGRQPSADLRLEYVVRQADSNLVAAKTAVDVGSIAPGATVEPSARVTVPDGYNYYVDAILRRGNVIVGSARGVVNLNPTERISANETVREVGLDVSDFEGAVEERKRIEETPQPEAAATQAPGFGVGAALAALIAAAIIARRRNT